MAGPIRTRALSLATTAALVVVAFASTAATTRPTRDSGWDPRIAPIAREVEHLRHLRFDHPIPVRFLSDKKFRKLVTSDDEKQTAKAKRRQRVVEAELRALGLVDGSFDVRAKSDEVNGDSVAAFYDPDHERMVVRGTKIDPELRVTIAHELTHGLQDQHYDLNGMRDRAKTSSADDAIVALVEGDATRIEDAYYDTLSRKDQRAVDRAESGTGSGPANPDVAHPSEAASDAGFVGAQLEAPYALGPSLVDVVLAHGHRAGLDRAFRHPPTTQLQFLLATTLFDSARARRVARPPLPAGAHVVRTGHPGDFGALDLYFTLASRVPAPLALRAADGWGGGKVVVSRSARGICVDVALAGRDRATDARLRAAIALWTGALPVGTGTTTRHGLGFRACDPGPSAAAPPNSAEDALGFAAVRGFIVADMVHEGIPAAAVSCLADAIVARPEYQPFAAGALTDTEPTDAQVKGIQDAFEAVAPSCR